MDLNNAKVASVFAHEGTHVWQRQHGEWVTLKGAALQAKYEFGVDVYSYDTSVSNPNDMLNMFKASNLEQQGKMVQDFVFTDRTGGNTHKFSAIANYLKSR